MGPASTEGARVVIRGEGRAEVSTGLPVLDELLGHIARAARFDLELVEGTTGTTVGQVEAAGTALGRALAEALAAPEARGLGDATAPADEALAQVAVEASGRPLVVSNVDLTEARLGGLRGDLLDSLLRALAAAGGLTIHVRLLHGEDTRHVLDAIAKALGLALARACSLER